MLDIRTLYVAHVAAIVTAGAVMLLSRLSQPDARSVGTWGGSAVCLGVGMALTSLRGIAPDWLSVLVANGIGAMCPLMIWNGILKFNGRPTRWRETFVLDAVFIAAMAYYVYVDENLSARIALSSLLMGGGSAASAYELFRRTNPALRRMSWTAGGALMLVFAAQLSRLVTVLVSAPQSDLFAPTLVNQVTYLAGMVVSSLVIFCLAMMANLQLQLQLGERSAELEQIARDRDHARQRAEQANRAKSTFLATMSHELRTPLNAILGFSEIIGREMFGRHEVSAYKTYANDIHNSGSYLLSLVNDILDLTRIEAGRRDLHDEPLIITDTLEDVRNFVAFKLKEKAQTLSFDIPAALPKVMADRRAVRQIWINLLSNAAKFSPRGGEIMVRAGCRETGEIAVSFIDNGPGMPEEEIELAMQAFSRGSLAVKKAVDGAGLGLPIVKGLVSMHGGHFELRSKPGHGTEATVVFPLNRVLSGPRVGITADPAASASQRKLIAITS